MVDPYRTDPSEPVVLGGAYNEAGDRVQWLEDENAPGWTPPEPE